MEIAETVEEFAYDAPERHHFRSARFWAFEKMPFTALGGDVRRGFDFGLRIRYRHLIRSVQEAVATRSPAGARALAGDPVATAYFIMFLGKSPGAQASLPAGFGGKQAGKDGRRSQGDSHSYRASQRDMKAPYESRFAGFRYSKRGHASSFMSPALWRATCNRMIISVPAGPV